MKLHTSPLKKTFWHQIRRMWVNQWEKQLKKINPISNPSCSFAIFQRMEAKIAMRYCLWRRFFLVSIWRTKIETSSQFAFFFLLLGIKCLCKPPGNRAETERECLWLFKKKSGACYFGSETDQNGQGRSRTFSLERHGKTASYQTSTEKLATFTQLSVTQIWFFFQRGTAKNTFNMTF